MRAVNIVGFKDTGKTTLCVELIRELTAVGIQAAALKFTHQTELDKPGTDTAKLFEVSPAVAAVGGHESAIFWRAGKSLADMLPLLGQEMLVAEGGKSLTVMPRIVIARSGAEARELGAGDNGLALAVYGPEGVDGTPPVRDAKELARRVSGRAFLLPGLDCGACGWTDCRALAVEIVAGRADASECVALVGEMSVTVNGAALALNPFVARILRAGLTAMLRELKGYAAGDIHISLRD